MFGKASRRWLARLFPLLLPVALLFAFGGASASSGAATSSAAVTSSSLGTYNPTFVGPAAFGCDGCQLLQGPYHQPAVSGTSTSTVATALADHPRKLPSVLSPQRRAGLHAAATVTSIPDITCQPLGPGCDMINTSSGGAVGVKGINAVDNVRAQPDPNAVGDVEPPDQGVCAGNGSVIETNNVGEMQIFNTALAKTSPVISLDTVMGLGKRGWSSAGDPSCVYDHSNGGHWFITEMVSSSPESAGGPFAGCFAAKPNNCYEGIAVTKGNSAYGPYNVYFLNANYNPNEPGDAYLLNDFGKIATSRDAFLLFYDEFPLNGPTGFGGGFFNGAQQFAFTKTAMEQGQPVLEPDGSPNPGFNVAIENMGLLPTPNGTCSKDNTYHEGGVSCWYSVIPAHSPDLADFDNSHGGSAFMLNTLDFYGTGDNRLAVWHWTGLSNLNSAGCSTCSAIKFGGQLFSGVKHYYDPAGLPSGLVIPQKAGPIPLGDQCGKAGLSYGNPPPAHCPESGLATNGDNITQASQAGGYLWASASTEVQQQFASNANGTETHVGAVYWVIGTQSFDSSGAPSLTSQGYVSPAHEDLSMPAMAGEGNAVNGGNGKGIILFTLAGNGGPSVADNGGFYPSTAYGRVTPTSNGLVGSVIHVADMGKSPQDGFTEYLGYPNAPPPYNVRQRWGDYSAAVFLPNSGGRIYFANEYIQYPNCEPPAFTLTVGTCGGTRNGYANWGTSVNYVVP